MRFRSLLRNTFMMLSIAIGNTGLSQGPFNIGTIHPGDSIVIIYDVSINNPLVPPSTTQISNQGTVSGSNFSNQLTDDPDTGTPNDPTITLLNMYPLPVTFIEFKAYQKAANIEVSWKGLESGTYKYEVERSINGSTFSKIGEVFATGGSGILSYSFLDLNPNAGVNFYRLRILDNLIDPKYTAIVKVSLSGSQSMINFYPNPVTGGTLNMEMKNLPKGKYQVVLFNGLGQKVFQQVVEHNGGSGSGLIFLAPGLKPGLYQVNVTAPDLAITRTVLIN